MVNYDDVDEFDYLLKSIPILQCSEDWLEWESGMKTYLVLSSLDDVWEQKLPPDNASQATKDAWNRKSLLACLCIWRRCSDYAQHLIRGIKVAREARDALEKFYKPQGYVALAKTIRRFTNLRCSDCKDVNEYTKRFYKLVHELKSLDCNLPNAYLMCTYLQRLGPHFDTFERNFTQKHFICPPKGAEVPTLHDVVHGAMEAELIQNAFKSGNATAAGTTDRSERLVDHCVHCGRNGHSEATCRQKHPHLMKAWKDELSRRSQSQGRQRGGGRGRKRQRANTAGDIKQENE